MFRYGRFSRDEFEAEIALLATTSEIKKCTSDLTGFKNLSGLFC